jgi:hypothetical protein
MLRRALVVAVVAGVLAGCNSTDNSTFKTSASSPPIDNLPPGVKLPDQKGDAKGEKKPDPKKESN